MTSPISHLAFNKHPEYGIAAGEIWAYLYLDSEALVAQAKERILEVIENHTNDSTIQVG